MQWYIPGLISRIDSKLMIMQRLTFTLLCIPILVGPWCFGAWESWWFWIFSIILFAAATSFGIQACMKSFRPSAASAEAPAPDENGIWEQRQRTLTLLCLPFLAYAVWSLTRPIIFLTAERSVLVFLTPILLSVIIIFGLNSKERRLLFFMIMLNLLLLGLYGIVNHFVTDSRYVLWAQGYPQYIVDHRATGSYYCPNHFAGIMEIATAIGLGITLTRRVSTTQRMAGLGLVGMGCVAILMSKSRGGGLCLVVIFLVALQWGFVNWPRRARWWWRLASLALGGILVAGIILFSHGFTARYTEYFRLESIKNKPLNEAVSTMKTHLKSTSRGIMYAAAIRAWKTAPIIGVGPGMHASQWFHFAPSQDGDPATHTWPSLPNYKNRSDEAHSDWIELLEEYGLLGLILVLIPASYLARLLTQALQQDNATRRERERLTAGTYFPREAMALSALLAYSALLCHSLGDFNLQIPATAWMFAAILALPIGMIGDKRIRARRE